MTKYDHFAIAALIALMAWAAAEKSPRSKLLSAWGGIVSFIALAIVGLFYVKWSPYHATALVAAHIAHDDFVRRTGLSPHCVNYFMAQRASGAEHFYFAILSHDCSPNAISLQRRMHP